VVEENAGSAILRVERFGQSTGAAQVDYLTLDETAIGAEDYHPRSGSLHFEPFKIESTFAVGIINDGFEEPVETFLVQLTPAAGGGALGLVPAVQVTIMDNDKPLRIIPEVPGDFESAPGISVLLVREDDGEESSLISYSLHNGTARAGNDFIADAGIVEIPPGGSRTIFVPLIDDVLIEPDRTFTFQVDTASASSISSAPLSLEIWDNERPGAPEGPGPVATDPNIWIRTVLVQPDGKIRGWFVHPFGWSELAGRCTAASGSDARSGFPSRDFRGRRANGCGAATRRQNPDQRTHATRVF
jgi:hypothetical protein